MTMHDERTTPELNGAISRRRLLKRQALGFGHLAWMSLLAEQGLLANPASLDERARLRATSLPRRARRVIFLFMKGGPSHLDTFEYKPLLHRDHGKDLPFKKPRVQFAKTGKLLRSPWEFRRYGDSGSLISDLFPNVAKHADEMCFLHSVHGTNAAHGGACLKLHTGSDNFVRPSLGAWVSYGIGTENHDLPSFVTICPTLAHGGVNNWGSAFLPATHQGTPLGVASEPATKARLGFVANTRLDARQQRMQLDLLRELGRAPKNVTGRSSDGVEQELAARLESFELAFRMQRSVPEAQDISRETKATRQLYGLDDPITADFGLQCLMARRFAERGVRFIQVTHSDTNVQWDQHGDLRKGHGKNAKEVDKPIAGLLSDLRSRGLLEDTLVVWSGEFGRTPTVQGKADGRDHNPEGFTVWMAGGAVRGGLHYGATDDYGYYAEQNPVDVHDLHATILALVGIDHEELTYRHAGRDFRLTDVHGRIVDEVFV